ncbi:hth domain-containing protein [Halosimplex carlsbadense 2-9-1]|uniref:Hth domain-containing protein n=1 Tax=Halosimplex carlsbadense 2-9-1 TaxID=797114 RepID=M0CCV8_9EURY|nr:hth domain-containing protein [Halosimplex carlsbadense]ELZ21065.1 hth domain-containing protein [Halosimplex carlsbadense 2-9-1]
MGNPERDNETGKFTVKYPREDFLEAIRKNGGMAGTSDIAESIGVIRETAYKKLKRMEEDGEVNSQRVGNSLVWTIEGHSEE